MKSVFLAAKVDVDKCNGDKLCKNACPSGAIRMKDKKANIDKNKCSACLNCFDFCKKGAISIVPREQPLIMKVDPALSDGEKIEAGKICRKAGFAEEERICVCNNIKAGEIAAAILRGAETPEDVSVMTGVGSVCGMWCIAPVLKLLKARIPDLSPQKRGRWHDTDPSLWNIPDAVAEKYPEYFIKEDREAADHGIFDNLIEMVTKGRFDNV
jgi:Fe-S-cluster-containing hydrogenase component 2